MVYTKTKAKKGLSKAMTKAVTKIVKKVDHKLAETKSYLGTASINPISDGWYSQNLIFALSQGITSTTLVGTKIFLKSFHLRVFYETLAARGSNPQLLRVAIIRAPQHLGSGLQSNSDIIRTPAGSTTYQHFLDYHKVSVLKEYKRFINPLTASQQSTGFDIKIPINKTVTFASDNGGYLKDANYYIIVNASDYSGVNQPGQFQISYEVNFQDS